MNAAPNFPTRPDTPEFWRMSRSAIDIDNRSKTELIEDIAASLGVNLEAVAYMSEQRVLRAVTTSDNKIQLTTLIALYLDAFVLGVRYAAEPEQP